MSQSTRQSELFTSSDWTILYKAFSQINFNASDPPSIHKALRQYLQTNYAEDFNDWIASSEFVMMLDMLAWLAGILAYKTDVSARENFFDTATARESILRLARFLSYNAKRNQAAQGLLKIVSVQTNDAVYDVYGNNLANQAIVWNDSNNADWFSQMILVLNSAFVSTNQFGVPLSKGSYANVDTQLYRLNANFGSNQTMLPFTVYLEGSSYPFELYNMNFNSTDGFTERTPTLNSALHCCYRSDGYGNASPDSGFFFGFKQGQLQSQIFNIATPTENQVLDIAVNNINQTDVWVQSIDSSGKSTIDWTQVPVLFSDNITYNSLAADARNIFSVITQDNDQVSLRFSDGRFANAPSGLIQAWYRTSNGQNYQIRPTDMGNPRVTLNYTNRRGVSKTLTLTFELTNPVSNSAPAETIDQVRRRASLVYATQNRMVSGEDYNSYPLQSNLATKIKALSRTYSGQSRFIDLNDPTANYQDTIVFADDGFFYSEDAQSYSEIPLSDNLSASQLIQSYIQPALQTQEVKNWFQNTFIQIGKQGSIVLPALTWTQASGTPISGTGYFNLDSQYLRQGAMVQFITPAYKTIWAGIAAVSGTANVAPAAGLAGPVTLAAPIPSGSSVVSIIPRFASTVTAGLITAIGVKINSDVSFDLWYDYATVDETAHLSIQPKSYTPSVSTQIKVMTVDCLSGAIWRIRTVGLRYVFESKKAVQFYFDGAKAVDINTGQQKLDLIRILDINYDLSRSAAFGRNYDLSIDKMIRSANGVVDARRVAVTFADSDSDGFPDDPDMYFKIISGLASSTYLFWSLPTAGGPFVPDYGMTVFAREQDRQASKTVGVGTYAFQVQSDTLPNTFWIMTANGWVEDYRNYRYGRGRGLNTAAKWVQADGTLDATIVPTSLRYMWQHYVPGDRRIDPARSNIIDMFVLPTEYDNLVRSWIANGCVSADRPIAFTDFDLRQSFATYETYKMFSDDIVWRPASYLFLFGQAADPAFRASFNVVKLSTSSLSSGEIKARVIAAINAYYSPDLWDFGETFYFTELTAYIHQQLAGVISSCVIVPETSDGSFGDLFEISCRSDQVFISVAQLSDINIVSTNTAANLRIH